jgi:hypothetical protein
MRGDGRPGGIPAEAPQQRHLASNVRVAVVLLVAGFLSGHASWCGSMFCRSAVVDSKTAAAYAACEHSFPRWLASPAPDQRTARHRLTQAPRSDRLGGLDGRPAEADSLVPLVEWLCLPARLAPRPGRVIHRRSWAIT